MFYFPFESNDGNILWEAIVSSYAESLINIKLLSRLPFLGAHKNPLLLSRRTDPIWVEDYAKKLKNIEGEWLSLPTTIWT